ncbi:MAG: hypothetical protein ACE145_16260 [Terriglobia bacterium]
MNEVVKNYVTIETMAYSPYSHIQALFCLTYEVTPRFDGSSRWFLVAMEELEAVAH